jgi:hypothetical protein
MAAVISRALDDLKKNRKAIRTSDYDRDEAMAWINGPECEAFCYTLDADYEAIQEQAAALYRRFLERAKNIPREKTQKPPGAYRGAVTGLTWPDQNAIACNCRGRLIGSGGQENGSGIRDMRL